MSRNNLPMPQSFDDFLQFAAQFPPSFFQAPPPTNGPNDWPPPSGVNGFGNVNMPMPGAVAPFTQNALLPVDQALPWPNMMNRAQPPPFMPSRRSYQPSAAQPAVPSISSARPVSPRTHRNMSSAPAQVASRQGNSYDSYRPGENGAANKRRPAAPPIVNTVSPRKQQNQQRNAQAKKDIEAARQTKSSGFKQPTKSPADTTKDPVSNVFNADYLSMQRKRAKQFLLAMHRENYGFDDLMKEDLDANLLRELYDELGIDLIPKNPPVMNSNNNVNATNQQQQSNGHLIPEPLSVAQQASVQETIDKLTASSMSLLPSPTSIAAVPVRPETTESKRPDPVSRQEYLARLSAVRSKKVGPNDDAKSPSTVIAQPAAIAAVEASTSPQDIAEAVPSLERDAKSPPQINIENDRQTILSELKAKALRAKAKAQAAKLQENTSRNVSNQAVVELKEDREHPEPSISGISLPLETLYSSDSNDRQYLAPTQQNAYLSTSRPNPRQMASLSQPTSPSSQIPGLFMTAPSSNEAFANAIPNVTDQAFATEILPAGIIRQKRPLASDFDAMLPERPAKRAFGQGRFDNHVEECIIETSGDEDDETNTSSKSNAKVGMAPAAQPLQAQLLDKQGLQIREQRIQELKRKILEKEILKKKARATSTLPGTPELSSAITTRPSASNARLRSQTPTSVLTTSSIAPSATTLFPIQVKSADSEFSDTDEHGLNSDVSPVAQSNADDTFTVSSLAAKDWKAKRKVEIESSLPDMEARNATDYSELAQLKERMMAIETRLQKDQERKQQLAAELQSLGVATDGIREENLQAAKDEVVAQINSNERDANEVRQYENTTSDQNNIEATGIDSPQSPDDSASSMSMSSSEMDDGEITDEEMDHKDAALVNTERTQAIIISDSDDSVDIAIEAPMRFGQGSTSGASMSRSQSGSQEDEIQIMNGGDSGDSAVDAAQANDETSSDDSDVSQDSVVMDVEDVYGSEDGEIDSVGSVKPTATGDIDHPTTDIRIDRASEAGAVSLDLGNMSQESQPNEDDELEDEYEPPEIHESIPVIDKPNGTPSVDEPPTTSGADSVVSNQDKLSADDLAPEIQGLDPLSQNQALVGLSLLCKSSTHAI